MKMKKAIAICTLWLMSIASFAQQTTQPGQPMIQTNLGAPDLPQGGHTAPNIGNAGKYSGCLLVPYEAIYAPLTSSTFDLFKLGPCGWGTDQHGSYRLAAPIQVQQISFWIGTSGNSRFETVSNLQIWTADGQHMMYDFLGEYDKHQDVQGQLHLSWSFHIPLSIPAGAIVKVYRYPGGLMYCGDNADPLAANASTPAGNWDHCATEIHWRLYGNGVM